MMKTTHHSDFISQNTGRLIFGVFLILLTLLFNTGCSRKSATAAVDIIDYQMDVLYKSAKHFQIMATITAEMNAPADQLSVFLNPTAKISAIQMELSGTWQNTEYSVSEDKILIHMHGLQKTKKCRIRFNYILPIVEPIDDFFYMDRGNRWYPLILDDVAKVRISAVVPSRYAMFSGGNLVESKLADDFSTYEWETQIPVFKIPFILMKPDRYHQITKECGDKELVYYFFQDTTDSNKKIIEEACRTFQFLNDRIGPYPHRQFTVIEMDMFQNYSFITTGLVLTSSDFIRQFRKGDYEGLQLPIATQWFGANVFGKFEDTGFWFFTLSFPHYLRLMYLESTKGEETFFKELQAPYDRYLEYADTEDDLPILSIDRLNTPAKGYTIIGKGPFLLDELREKLGDDKWQELLRSLYKTYHGNIMTYDAFMGTLTSVGNEKIAHDFEEMVQSLGDIRSEYRF